MYSTTHIPVPLMSAHWLYQYRPVSLLDLAELLGCLSSADCICVGTYYNVCTQYIHIRIYIHVHVNIHVYIYSICTNRLIQTEPRHRTGYIHIYLYTCIYIAGI